MAEKETFNAGGNYDASKGKTEMKDTDPLHVAKEYSGEKYPSENKQK
jgi:hypothetical protein